MSNLLYKYLDVNGAIMMLHYSNLMYANATMFNDPFDCHPSLIDFSNVPQASCIMVTNGSSFSVNSGSRMKSG